MRKCETCDGTGGIVGADDRNPTARKTCEDCKGEGMRATIGDHFRELALFLEDRPELLANVELNWPVTVWTNDADEFRHFVRLLGSADKKPNDYAMGLERKFGPIVLRVAIVREKVCTRRVTGTRVVPAQAERVEELYEWDCEPVLAGHGNDLPTIQREDPQA